MRRVIATFVTTLLLLGLMAVPAVAGVSTLDGPDPVFWLSDPEADVGVNGIEPGHAIDGASGTARVNKHGATISVHTTGLEPGHAYTMWVVYFNDQRQCEGGCGDDDFGNTGAGVVFGNGHVAGGSGKATFSARLHTGDGSDVLGPPPPPFAVAPYEASPHNEFHIVIRSHGPKIPGQVSQQISTFGGGCQTEVGPPPGVLADHPVPVEAGECGDVQLFIFS